MEWKGLHIPSTGSACDFKKEKEVSEYRSIVFQKILPATRVQALSDINDSGTRMKLLP
jgi:hypothetical protein